MADQSGRAVDDHILWLILILAYHALIGLLAAAAVGSVIWSAFIVFKRLLPRRLAPTVRSEDAVRRPPFFFRFLRGLVFLGLAAASAPVIWLISWYFLVYLRWESHVAAWDQLYVGLPISVFLVLMAVLPAVFSDVFFPPKKLAPPETGKKAEALPDAAPAESPPPPVAARPKSSIAGWVLVMSVYVIDGIMLTAASLICLASLGAKMLSREDLSLLYYAAVAVASSLFTMNAVRPTAHHWVVRPLALVMNLLLLPAGVQSWLRAFEGQTQLTPPVLAWLIGAIVLFNLLALVVTAKKRVRYFWWKLAAVGVLLMGTVGWFAAVVIWPRVERFRAQYPSAECLNKIKGRNAVIWRDFWVTQVFLSETSIDDLEIQAVYAFPRLKDLGLSRTAVSDAGLTRIASLRELDTLVLNETDITDETLERLAELKQLSMLYLENTKITDNGLEHVAQLDELWYLNLKSTKVTDRGVSRLKRLRKLRRLDLQETGVSDAIIKELKQALPDIWIDKPQSNAEQDHVFTNAAAAPGV